MDCPICLTSALFPVKLKCGHIYCYLCVKGVVNNSKKCPLCRKSISKNVLIRPKFVKSGVHSDRHDFSGQQWFYEGLRGTGFWAYDYFNGRILEDAYNSDKKICEITISGVEYCVDFVQRIQYRKDCPSRKRTIRRDLLSNIESFKGIAGVSKHLIRDLYQTIESNPISIVNTSGHNLSLNRHNSPAVCAEEEDVEQMAKRIKVEIKEEPKEPDSTTD